MKQQQSDSPNNILFAISEAILVDIVDQSFSTGSSAASSFELIIVATSSWVAEVLTSTRNNCVCQKVLGVQQSATNINQLG